MPEEWYQDHNNLITLICWMAAQPEYDKGDLAYAVEKPWKFSTEFGEAQRFRAEQDADRDPREKLMLNTKYGKPTSYDVRSAYPSALTEKLVDKMRGARLRKVGEAPATDSQVDELRAGIRDAVVREREAQTDE